MSGHAIGVGVVGLGKSGWNIHVRALRDRSDFRIVSVTDPMPERRQEAIDELGCTAYESPEEMYQEEDVELVVVATPSHTHADLTVKALNAGKHVLVEKPMATSVVEVDDMIKAAEKADRVLSVYQIRRLDADFLAVKDVLESGVLGPVVLVRMTRHSYNRRRDWQTLKKFGGGTLNNWGSHIVDMGLELMDGEYDSFFADMKNVVSAGDAEDHIKVVLKREDLVVDVEISGAVAYPDPHWFVVGKYGTLKGNTNELHLKYYDPADAPELPPAAEIETVRRYSREELPWKEKVVTPKADVPRPQKFYDLLHDTIRRGESLFVTPESVRRQIKLFDEIRAATGF